MSVEQLDLLSAHARAVDPMTSALAAPSEQQIKASCRRLLAALWTHRWTMSTFTDGELAALVEDERSLVARRRGDLVEYGLCEPVWLAGEQETRRGPKGKFELVWLLTAQGCIEAARTAQ